MMSAEEVAREDLLTFLNAAFASTAQAEFASSASQQREAMAFLHEYVRGNYRRLYARLLAAGINDAHTVEIVVGLLSTGRQTAREFRVEENALLRAAVRHAHVRPGGELERFLFGSHDEAFISPLLDAYRRSHFSASALEDLPYTVALGLATRHDLAPEALARRMDGRLTDRERLRLARRAGEEMVDPARQSLTELASYLLTLPELSPAQATWMPSAARRVLQRSGPLPLGRADGHGSDGAAHGPVAAVLDNSYSSSGSRAKRNRPLAVAWAVDALLRESVHDYRGFWAHPVAAGAVPRSQGRTNLAERLLDALDWGAGVVVVVSDGVENDPPGAFHAVLQQARRLVPGLEVIHLNPVFDPLSLQVRSLSPLVAALGVRNGEDLPALLGMARYVQPGLHTLEELEDYLARRVRRFVEGAHA